MAFATRTEKLVNPLDYKMQRVLARLTENGYGMSSTVILCSDKNNPVRRILNELLLATDNKS